MELNRSNTKRSKRETGSNEEQNVNHPKFNNKCILIIMYEEKLRKKQKHGGKLTPRKMFEALSLWLSVTPPARLLLQKL